MQTEAMMMLHFLVSVLCLDERFAAGRVNLPAAQQIIPTVLFSTVPVLLFKTLHCTSSSGLLIK